MQYDPTVIAITFEDGSKMEWKHTFESSPVFIISEIQKLIDEDLDLQYRMSGDGNLDPDLYFDSVQHADDDPYGHHLRHDVI